MRAVFIFVVLLLVLAMAVPVTFVVRFWMDGGAVLARAERGGALSAPVASGPLTAVERTIAMDHFRETWKTHAFPCRTAAFLWADVTTDDAPSGMSVSQRFATSMLPERRDTSIRWQIRRLIVACQLERRFDDPRLLRMWLARANFGQNTIGIDNASLAIFNKPSSALNAEESARMSALLRWPNLRAQPQRWAERSRAIQERIAPR